MFLPWQCRGFALHIQNGSKMKNKQTAGKNSSGFTNKDLLDQSQSPRYSPEMGAVVTNDKWMTRS